MMRHLFIHLDDQSAEVQMALYKVIVAAIHLNPAAVLKEANKVVEKQTYPQKTRAIIKLTEQRILESDKLEAEAEAKQDNEKE